MISIRSGSCGMGEKDIARLMGDAGIVRKQVEDRSHDR